MKLYIVLHHEIFYGEHVDEMVFFVASSLEKAIEMIKESYGVSSYSWWEIQSYELDTLDWPEHVGWYGRKGGKLKEPPFHKALKAYEKEHKDGSS